MKKTMTIYELLGLIKDGKAPKEVKYKETKYVFNNDRQCYENSYEWFPSIQEIGLNDEVEILDEDEFIDIEEITQECFDNWTCAKHINQLIKNQKKIIERLSNEVYSKH